MTGYVYVDASALVKLVLEEAESPALRQFLVGRNLTSADIVEVEVHRTARRRQGAALGGLLEDVLGRVFLHSSDQSIRHEARAVAPGTLRTLDAIHLATALRLAPELDAFVCYDARLCDAARAAGLCVESPQD